MTGRAPVRSTGRGGLWIVYSANTEQRGCGNPCAHTHGVRDACLRRGQTPCSCVGRPAPYSTRASPLGPCSSEGRNVPGLS